MEQIETYLETYQDLWWNINEKCDDNDYPFMDVCLDIVGDDDITEEEGNYLGCDVFHKNRVLQLSFLGECSLFPGFL